MLQPLYTAENIRFAYQLRWGVTVHWTAPVSDTLWLEPARNSLANDNLRILSSRWLTDCSSQFAISSQPNHSPSFIVQRLKGRIQYAAREHCPKALRSHYSLRSFGTQERRIIENYVLNQTNHHKMATPKAQGIFESLRYHDKSIDLAAKQNTTHGVYWYNLHVVLVSVGRWCDVNEERLARVKRVLLASADQQNWRISTLSILADHLHATIGCPLDISPETVALSMMNNIAWVYDMKPILQHSAFIATFGEYDQRAIRQT